MNTRLNKSDYLLLAIYFFIATALQVFDYYETDHNPIEYLLDIPTGIVVAVGLIFLFMNWLVPRYLIQNKSYLRFVLFALALSLIHI